MSKKNIVIAGSGFAGMWAALAAARAVDLAGSVEEIVITVVSPTPHLHIRPRLYETAFNELAPDLGPLFEAVGVQHIAGKVTQISPLTREVTVLTDGGSALTLNYERFVLATGSSLFMPPIPGVKEYAFNVDQLESAEALNKHLISLAQLPETPARNTVIIAGGGFTGIETAAEMPARLRAVLGEHTDVKVVLLEVAPAVGPDLGENPRPVIEEALQALGVRTIVATGVVSIDADGVNTSTGEHISAQTVIWTAGMRANALTSQIPGEHDRLGRVHVDRELRANDAQGIFVAGDVGLAASDDLGNHALMSCQHAMSLGRVAGYNAAAELVGLPTHPYSQAKYVTCLDLGPWGALYAEGWDRQILFVRDEAKALKRQINTAWIYPPAANREAAFAVANPDYVIVP